MRLEAEVSASAAPAAAASGERGVGEAGRRVEADARFADLDRERRRRALRMEKPSERAARSARAVILAAGGIIGLSERLDLATILGTLPKGEKVGIAFSGGLDTSAALHWMRAEGRDPLRLHRQPRPARRARLRRHPAQGAAVRRREGAPDRLPRRSSSPKASPRCSAAPSTSPPPACTYFNTTPLGRAVTGTMLVRRDEGRRRQHLGRRQHLQGQRHRALLPLRPARQPGAAIYKPWLDQRVHRRARRPRGDVGVHDAGRLRLQDDAPRRPTRPTPTCSAPRTRPRTSSASTRASRSSQPIMGVAFWRDDVAGQAPRTVTVALRGRPAGRAQRPDASPTRSS